MRILLVISYVPRPEMSGTLRTYFFLAGLARRHSVRVLVGTYDPSFWTPADVDHVRGLVEGLEICPLTTPRVGPLRRAVHAIAAGVSRSSRPWWLDATFERRIADEVAAFRPDVVFAEGSAALHCHALRDVPVVVDFYDAHGLRVDPARDGRVGAWRRRTAIASREAFVGSFARSTIAITERDADAVRVPRDRVVVIPNGVDLEHYVPGVGPWEPNSLAFVGAMDYPPNADAAMYLARDVWPRVRRAEPKARLFIVGRRPGPDVEALDGHDGITVTGTVDDVRPYVWRSAATVAPLRFASGLQNKVLQSLAMEVPVIATPAATAGLRAGESEGVIVADTPAGLAEAFLSLARDPERRTRLGVSGRRFVVENYRWDREIERLEGVFEQAVADQRASRR
jgi:glycosyltransferase involved in cell wall biosynthesis